MHGDLSFKEVSGVRVSEQCPYIYRKTKCLYKGVGKVDSGTYDCDKGGEGCVVV